MVPYQRYWNFFILKLTEQFLVEQQVKSQTLYLHLLKEHFTMFHVFKYLLFVFCILKPCISKLRISDLKSCKEETHVSKICLTGENGYLQPFPVVVFSELVLRHLIEIDEDKHSITAEFELWTWWEDPGIALSNVSSR